MVAHLNDANGIDVSIIIPTLNEAENLRETLHQIYKSAYSQRIEVIISDGGSLDSTPHIAAQYPCAFIKQGCGRAQQMNSAAKQARGSLFLFLHADTRLPEDWYNSVIQTGQWGFFPVELSGNHWLLRVIERTINLRSRLTKVAGGDQVLFFRQPLFTLIGGFANIPLMEDIAICKKARRMSKPHIPIHSVITSSRRWETRGIVRTVLLMWLLRFGYFVGLSPERLHRLYYPHQR